MVRMRDVLQYEYMPTPKLWEIFDLLSAQGLADEARRAFNELVKRGETEKPLNAEKVPAWLRGPIGRYLWRQRRERDGGGGE